MTQDIIARVAKDRVTEYDDHFIVNLGPGGELVMLVAAAMSEPGKAAVLEGPVQGIVSMEGRE